MIFYSLTNGGYQFMNMRIITGTNNTSNSIKVTERYGVSKNNSQYVHIYNIYTENL